MEINNISLKIIDLIKKYNNFVSSFNTQNECNNTRGSTNNINLSNSCNNKIINDNKIINNSNNNSNNKITNNVININIENYNDNITYYKTITDSSEFQTLLKKKIIGVDIIDKIFAFIFFNKDYPQHHSIRIDTKDNITIMNNNKWKGISFFDIFNNFIKLNISHIENLLKNIVDEENIHRIITRVKRFIDEKDKFKEIMESSIEKLKIKQNDLIENNLFNLANN